MDLNIIDISLLSALIAGISGAISSFIVTKLQLNQKTKIWNSEFAVNYSKLYSNDPPATKVLLKQFSIGLIIHIDEMERTINKYYIPNQFKLSIGRNVDNDIICNDNYASRDHGLFFSKGHSVYYQDLSPLHKTKINEKEIIKCCKLNNKDKIKIGNSIFEYIQLK
ncbi:FHA domain-containing protein [Bacteroides neonati]|uniref:FHA domain-containing protein n=1 Tax=Bacteroides neonati TaxID=1347393 RepID=UPI0005A893B2|nr:FHA domain-containing protein [Bacteroides neonati]